jgi:DNA ligase-1
MSQDELAEIDGIKPKVALLDGEEKEVSSMTRCEPYKLCRLEIQTHLCFFFSNSVYKVKRTFDHFYW